MKNKIELKKTIIHIIFVIIISTIIFGGISYYQYRQYTNRFNNKIADIVTKLTQEYPELNQDQIFEIFNSEEKMNKKLFKS